MMTAETAKLTLAEQLERGPGSRELSDEVLLWLGWSTREFNSPGHGTVGHTWIMPGGGEPNPEMNIRVHVIRPSPTESVDDALVLVPEGWRVHECRESDNNSWRIMICNKSLMPVNSRISRTNWVSGDNPLPRAICLAVLRAKEHLAEDDFGEIAGSES